MEVDVRLKLVSLKKLKYILGVNMVCLFAKTKQYYFSSAIFRFFMGFQFFALKHKFDATCLGAVLNHHQLFKT